LRRRQRTRRPGMKQTGWRPSNGAFADRVFVSCGHSVTVMGRNPRGFGRAGSNRKAWSPCDSGLCPYSIDQFGRWNLCKIDHSFMVSHENNFPRRRPTHQRRALTFAATLKGASGARCSNFCWSPTELAVRSASAPIVAALYRTCLYPSYEQTRLRELGATTHRISQRSNGSRRITGGDHSDGLAETHA